MLPFKSPLAHILVVGMLRFMSCIYQPRLPTPPYSVFVSSSVFLALSTVFHSKLAPNSSPFSDSVLPVLSLPSWSFQLYISWWLASQNTGVVPLWRTTDSYRRFIMLTVLSLAEAPTSLFRSTSCYLFPSKGCIFRESYGVNLGQTEK